MNYQHGLQKGHSCHTQLVFSVHEWSKSIDHEASSHIYFWTSPKHHVQFSFPLLLKLEHVGVRGTLLHWVRGFLNDQEQRVIVDGQMSDRAQVASGVPQGSILGPLLFLIYTNHWY